jgi:hypothetical protein
MSKYTEDKKSEALTQIEAGTAIKYIADQLGIPRSTVYRWRSESKKPEAAQDLDLEALEARILSRVPGTSHKPDPKLVRLEQDLKKLRSDFDELFEYAQGLKVWVRDNFTELEKQS